MKAQRIMKDRSFVDVNDGSTNKNLQIVLEKADHKKPGHASSVSAKGILSQTPKGQLELKADEFQVISMSGDVTSINPVVNKNFSIFLDKCEIDEFPFLARKTYPPEYIREHLHLRPRLSGFSSMLRVRHHAAAAFHDYFHRTGCIQIHTPILTSNDCEGAGEVMI